VLRGGQGANGQFSWPNNSFLTMNIKGAAHLVVNGARFDTCTALYSFFFYRSKQSTTIGRIILIVFSRVSNLVFYQQFSRITLIYCSFQYYVYLKFITFILSSAAYLGRLRYKTQYDRI